MRPGLIIGFLMGAVVVTATTLIVVPAAFACTLLPQAHVEAQDSSRSSLLGVRGDVFVNSWDSSESSCSHVRSLAVWKDDPNSVEAGWVQAEAGKYVFWVNLKDNVVHTHITGLGLGSDTYPAFKIHNGNQDSYWEADYLADGSSSWLSLNNWISVISTFVHANAVLTNSERHYSGDSLWAHFRTLKDCTDGGCTFQTWGNIGLFDNNSQNGDQYYLCVYASANDEHWVKQNCAS